MNDACSHPPPPGLLEVSPAEAGMKLLRFLERRLEPAPSQSVLHKWIRTGQVRVNKGRAKAFQLLYPGDTVRVPPFAERRALLPEDTAEPDTPGALLPGSGPAMLRVQDANDDYLVLAKPSGLACQPGTGETDCVSARLAAAYAGRPFIPAPAHRLDRLTSGLLLAGKSLPAQQRLHILFKDGGIVKDYLAWVWGSGPSLSPCLMRDDLAVGMGADGRETVMARPGGQTLSLTPDVSPFLQKTSTGGPTSPPAAAIALPLHRLQREELPPSLAAATPKDGAATLLLLRLLTGRKHQLRVQLSSRGCPVIGDGRYGAGFPRFSPMLLHACALSLPSDLASAQGSNATGRLFFLLPEWPAPFIPALDEVTAGRAALGAVSQ